MDVGKNENELSNVSLLEINASARSDRLKRLRSQVGAAKKNENDNIETCPLIFRSYTPLGLEKAVVRKVTNEEKFSVVERKIGDMIEDTLNTNSIKDELDLETLAPKKVDWDLKRGIQSRLDILNKKTEKSISHFIRKRVNEGDTQLLPAAINLAIRAQNNDEDDVNSDESIESD